LHAIVKGTLLCQVEVQQLRLQLEVQQKMISDYEKEKVSPNKTLRLFNIIAAPEPRSAVKINKFVTYGTYLFF
jgi:hypothetical protein